MKTDYTTSLDHFNNVKVIYNIWEYIAGQKAPPTEQLWGVYKGTEGCGCFAKLINQEMFLDHKNTFAYTDYPTIPEDAEFVVWFEPVQEPIKKPGLLQRLFKTNKIK